MAQSWKAITERFLTVCRMIKRLRHMMMMFPLIEQESLSAVTSRPAEFCHLARHMNHDHENLCKRILIGKFF